ncbi:hypothetical protein K469DRAFT_661699 [Zopfia rhizophila CBS 207.26]|uniref:SnoaL-like domain-containing protein n=1 Tax=Zopfia rhizophila CBS 207.26 TaxID=1314779 RepID=A0A6A6E6Z3_9PEZI|nr:hypothetical protein K469DRAFT_661699 [Zopfia rhizophila CBS 207.26]
MTASTPTNRSDLLRNTKHSFCKALLDPPPPSELLSSYFSGTPRITEHAPSWATSRLPFLGKTFEGLDGCVQYFDALAKTLGMDMGRDTFPGVDGFIVDIQAQLEAREGKNKGMVSVVGKARFKSIKTGKDWHEQFIYRFSDFDEQGKIGHWEIWADPLSAWEAVGS